MPRPIDEAHSAFAAADWAKAEGLYSAAINEFAESGSPPALAYLNLAEARYMQSNFSGAASALERGLNTHPESVDLLNRLGQLSIDQYTVTRNPLRAVRCFREIKRIDPNFRSGPLGIDNLLRYAKMVALNH